MLSILRAHPADSHDFFCLPRPWNDFVLRLFSLLCHSFPIFCQFFGALWTQTRVGDFVDAEVDEREAGAQYGDTGARTDEPPPDATTKRPGLLRPVEHTTPAGNRTVTKAKKLQRRPGQYHIDGGADKTRDYQADLIGEYLEEDDTPGTFSTCTGCCDKFAAAERQRLRTQHARLPRPVCNDNHQGDRQWATREIGREHNRQGERGQHQ